MPPDFGFVAEINSTTARSLEESNTSGMEALTNINLSNSESIQDSIVVKV